MQKNRSFLKGGVFLSAVVSLLLLGCSEEKNMSQVEKKVEKTVEKSAEVAEVVEEKIAEVKEKIEDVEEEVQKKVEAVKEEIVAAVEQKTGEDIYKTCASCHGQKAEKAALGKSQVIQAWEVSKTLSALQGYKDGSYGGAMKGMMKGQVSKLSDEDMKRVAEYISTL